MAIYRRSWPAAATALLILAACEGDTGYPALMPTDQLLAPPAMPVAGASTQAEAAGDLAARGDALRQRGGKAASTGDLSQRADALRKRAEVLRNQSLDCDPAASDCPTEPN